MAPTGRVGALRINDAGGTARRVHRAPTEVDCLTSPSRWTEPARHLGHETVRPTGDPRRIQTHFHLGPRHSNYRASTPAREARPPVYDRAFHDAHVPVSHLGHIFCDNRTSAVARCDCLHSDGE